jgi:5-methyltetrahydropteroyltriglutamate--homocysteine methyltransferase
MKIRGHEVLLPTTTVGAYPRPHWLQGRTFGTRTEPLYRSYAQRVAFEDATKICAKAQEDAGLDILSDGHQYYEWEAAGFQLEPIFHYITEMLDGFNPYGPPGAGEKYKYFYQAEVVAPIRWVRSMFEGVVSAMQGATVKPFKLSFLGPAQNSVIVSNRHYKDNIEVAMAMAGAMNQELKHLQAMGLEAIQLIDVLPPYTQDLWQIEVQHRLFEGITMTKLWHICYGSVDGQTDVHDDRMGVMLPLFHASPVDVIHVETKNRAYRELGALREFPTNKVLGIGVIDTKSCQIETADQVARDVSNALHVVPPERLMVQTDCGLGYFSRTVAYAKLKALGDGVRKVRAELGK